MSTDSQQLEWHRVAAVDELPDGRVKTVTTGVHSMALTHIDGAFTGLADALRLQEAQGRLRFYGIRHEGAAAFACSGYAKLTGKPAACLTIAGPGATKPAASPVRPRPSTSDRNWPNVGPFGAGRRSQSRLRQR